MGRIMRYPLKRRSYECIEWVPVFSQKQYIRYIECAIQNSTVNTTHEPLHAQQ
jgi:hypothetical protein